MRWVVSLTSVRLASGEQAAYIHWIWRWSDSWAELDVLDKEATILPTGNWTTILQLPIPYPKPFVTSAVTMEQSPSWESRRSSASQVIPTFYDTRKFITAFTRAHHLSLSSADQSSAAPHPTTWSSTLILFSYLHEGPFLRFPYQKPVCNSPLSHTCHVNIIPYSLLYF